MSPCLTYSPPKTSLNASQRKSPRIAPRGLGLPKRSRMKKSDKRFETVPLAEVLSKGVQQESDEELQLKKNPGKHLLTNHGSQNKRGE
jgi:hypothetical protein